MSDESLQQKGLIRPVCTYCGVKAAKAMPRSERKSWIERCASPARKK